MFCLPRGVVAALFVASGPLFGGCDADSPTGDGAGGAGGAGANAGGAGGGGTDCPDPDKPGVRYFSSDPQSCRAEDLSRCVEGENGFFTSCGCGCFPKGSDATCPTLGETEADFRSRDPLACENLVFECPFSSVPFRNSCGCGCLPR